MATCARLMVGASTVLSAGQQPRGQRYYEYNDGDLLSWFEGVIVPTFRNTVSYRQIPHIAQVVTNDLRA